MRTWAARHDHHPQWAAWKSRRPQSPGDPEAGYFETAGRLSDAIVSEWARRLLDLGYRHGPLLVYGSQEWATIPPVDPRRFASVVRVAECWRLDGADHAIRARLLDELEVADLLARWRVRMAGHDIRGNTDWGRVHAVVAARTAYRERWGVPA